MNAASIDNARTELRFLIVGMARSGTTLLQRLACEIDGVSVPPETHFWPIAERYVDRLPLDETSAGQLVDAVIARMDVGPVVNAEDVLRTAGTDRRPWKLFTALVEQMSQQHILGEKTPIHLLYAGPLLAAHPELRVIMVVRDPRDVHAALCAVDWGPKDPIRNAWRWRLRHMLVEDLIASFRERVLTVRFEDMVSDPDGTRAQVAGLLGVTASEVTPARPEPGVLFPTWETWKERALGPPDTSRVGRWREVLDDDVASAIWEITAEVAERWGYEPGEQPTRHAAVPHDDGRILLAERRLTQGPLLFDRAFYS